MRRIALFLVFFFVVCCTPAPATGAVRYFPWAHKRMELVVDSRAPQCLYWALAQAHTILKPKIDFAVRQGGNTSTIEQVPIIWDDPNAFAAGAGGVTMARRLGGRTVQGLYTVVHTCDVRLVTHEVGHLFGLPDRLDKDHVMSWHVDLLGFTLEPEERATIDAAGTH